MDKWVDPCLRLAGAGGETVERLSGYSRCSHGILYGCASFALGLGSGLPGVAPVMALTAGAFL